MTRPVSSAARASGTMTYQPVNSMAIQAPRTAWASWLVAAVTPTAMYATTAPSHPSDDVRWTVSTNWRTAGAIIKTRAQIPAAIGGVLVSPLPEGMWRIGPCSPQSSTITTTTNTIRISDTITPTFT